MSTPATSELERILQIPPPTYQPGQVVAHAALEALRDNADEQFLFLRTILELSSDVSLISGKEELIFHCITGLRQVVLYRWDSSFTTQFKHVTRDFLLAIGLQLQMPRTTKLACFTTAASFWKREWNMQQQQQQPSSITQESPQQQSLISAMMNFSGATITLFPTCGDLFRHLETLLSQPQAAPSTATFLSILVGEFSGKSAVQYQLPLEFHKKAHSSFEVDDSLDCLLRLAMGALSQIVSQVLGQTTSATTIDESSLLPIVQLAIDIISWEFGSDAWDTGIPTSGSSKTLLRPPVSWRDYLIRPDLGGALVNLHNMVQQQQDCVALAHALRQLLLLLSSLSGTIFVDETQRQGYASYLLESTLPLLSTASQSSQQCGGGETADLLDSLSILSRLVANFKLAILIQLPLLNPLLSALTNTGVMLLQAHTQECEHNKGDIESMEHGEWREEALALLLEACILLANDPYLLYAEKDGAQRRAAQTGLAAAFSPLYHAFVSCRIQMARLEEFYLTSNAAELDEVREEISATELEEELESVAFLGRLSPSSSLETIAALYQPVLQNLEMLWNRNDITHVTGECAALLEEARLLTMSLGHLLTDENPGETPVLPVIACQSDAETTNGILAAVQSIMTIAQLQASKLAENPENPLLSPLLANAFLWFFHRWAPAYILPGSDGSVGGSVSQIMTVWGQSGTFTSETVAFCCTLCLHYHCYWPQEKLVQETACALLNQLAKRGEPMRVLMVAAPSFQQIAILHCVTAGLCHNSPFAELRAAIERNAPNGGCSAAAARGYQRLPYEDRSHILTSLLLTTSNEPHSVIFNQCLAPIETGFKQLVYALGTKQIDSSSLHAKEMANLSVSLYGGIARSSEIPEPERIVTFMTPALSELSGLMKYYSSEMSICESLLALFRDYTEHFITLLDRDQSTALFSACADLLRSYSSNHVASRVVVRPSVSCTEQMVEEEQSYSDVLCAIQLLIHLGTKDFLDLGTASPNGVESGKVTDIIFYGLQQVLPLMTQGLLQFPNLCTNYFSLVGFMMETYADKVCQLPYDLFDSLLESLLFGMSHVDVFVAKSSLQGIAGIANEQLQRQTLSGHLASHPDIFAKCTQRLLQEVVFQGVVWDRIEACGLALLPLAATDMNGFVAVVKELAAHVPPAQQSRLHHAFEVLIEPEMLGKAMRGGYEGRMNRVKFKKNFELFVKDIHSFLVIK